MKRFDSLFFYVVHFCIFLIFFCLFLHISIQTPLVILAVCGGIAAILNRRRLFNPYVFAFIIFFMILCWGDIFRTEEAKVSFLTRTVGMSFLSGIALYRTTKTDATFFSSLASFACVFSVAGVSIWYALTGQDAGQLFAGARFQFLALQPNVFAIMTSTCVVSGVALLFCDPASRPHGSFILEKMSGRVLTFCVTVCCFALLCMTMTRTSIYGSVLVSLFVILFYMRKRLWSLFRWVAVGVVVLTGLCIVWHFAPIAVESKTVFGQRVVGALAAPTQDTTFRSRMAIWESAEDALRKNPLWGYGPKSYTALHQAYVAKHYEELVNSYGRDIVDGDTRIVGKPHNQYLTFWLEYGIAQPVLFLILLMTPILSGLKRRSLYGVVVPLLCLFALTFCFEDLLYSKRLSNFSIFVFYTALGFFAVIGKAVPVVLKEKNAIARE